MQFWVLEMQCSEMPLIIPYNKSMCLVIAAQDHMFRRWVVELFHLGLTLFFSTDMMYVGVINPNSLCKSDCVKFFLYCFRRFLICLRISLKRAKTF